MGMAISLRAGKDSPIWDEVPTRAAASIFLGLDRKEVSKGLLLYLDQHPSEPALNEMLTHAVQLTPETDLEHCVRIADTLTRNSEDHREVLMQLLLDSFSSRPHPEVLRSWVARHVQECLQRLVDQKHIMSWSVTGSGIWPLQTRSKTGGELTISSSIGRGESYVGNRTSDPFTAPEKLHSGSLATMATPIKAAIKNCTTRPKQRFSRSQGSLSTSKRYRHPH